MQTLLLPTGHRPRRCHCCRGPALDATLSLVCGGAGRSCRRPPGMGREMSACFRFKGPRGDVRLRILVMCLHSSCKGGWENLCHPPRPVGWEIPQTQRVFRDAGDPGGSKRAHGIPPWASHA